MAPLPFKQSPAPPPSPPGASTPPGLVPARVSSAWVGVSAHPPSPPPVAKQNPEADPVRRRLCPVHAAPRSSTPCPSTTRASLPSSSSPYAMPWATAKPLAAASSWTSKKVSESSPPFSSALPPNGAFYEVVLTDGAGFRGVSDASPPLPVAPSAGDTRIAGVMCNDDRTADSGISFRQPIPVIYLDPSVPVGQACALSA